MKRVIFGLVLIGFFISTSYAQDLHFDSKQARDNYFEKEYQAKVKQLEKDKAELKSELKKKFDQQKPGQITI